VPLTGHRKRPRGKRAIGNEMGRSLFDVELNIAFGGQLMQCCNEGGGSIKK